MAKPGVKPGRRVASEAKARIVEAAIETLKHEGFAGTSAGAIARRGGFSQGLIFYHFGSVNDVLLAALEETSARRMRRYREAVERVSDFPSLMQVAADIYREDLDSGHITVLAELIAGSSAVPDLGPRVVALTDPWIRFTEDTIRRVLANSAFAQLLPVQPLAFAVVALYLGVELLTHLEQDRSKGEDLIQAAVGAAPILEQLIGMSSGHR
jgi:AcrR family transcriptional regulator